MWTPSVCIAAAAAFIAACGFFLSFYQGWATRNHYRLSVKPHVNISFHFQDMGTDPGAGYIMSTPGLGPVVVKKFERQVDGQIKNNWFEMLSSLQISSPSGQFVNPTAVYSPNKEFRILWLPKGPASEALKKENGRIELIIEYCSMYGDECWIKSSKDKQERVSFIGDSIICGFCKEKNNPAFKKCWKCEKAFN